MVKKCLFLFISLIISLGTSNSQSNENKEDVPKIFVNLTEKGTVYPDSFDFFRPRHDPAYFIIDGENVFANKVNYFQSAEGFFIRNTHNKHKQDEFLRQEIKGKINIYSITHHYYYNSVSKIFYTKENYDLKKFNAPSLLKDLYDNPISKKYLKTAIIFRNFHIGAYILGSGLILASIPFMAKSGETAGPLFLSGAGCFIVGIPLGIVKHHKIKKAVRIYNE